MTRFGAPWGPIVWVPTVIGSLVIVALGVGSWISTGIVEPAVLHPLLIGVCALFTIRGYTVTRDAILVQRLFWKTSIPRRGLRSATLEPLVVRGSWRVWGNYGMFAVSGWFRNKRLGAYRAFVTDSRRAVVLRYASRTVVVSPDNPGRFIDEVLGKTVTVDSSAAMPPPTGIPAGSAAASDH
jgi:hypothetical protein